MVDRPPDGTVGTLGDGRGRGSAAYRGALTIRVVEGPDAGKSVTLDDGHAGRLFVGRSPACELQLADERVSRRHIAFELVEGRVRVLDLESTNGTRVGKLMIVGAVLEGGEQITLGATRLVVEHDQRAKGHVVAAASRYGRTIGASREMRRLYPLCAKLAASRVPVLIEGETGTGKEVLAESLHEEGPRRERPFVVFDCTTVPPNLMESELFGYERGAFTGATTARAGVFEQADGGTLLVDEIGDLDLPLQAKLLRAFDRMEFRRLGGTKARRFDVRMLAATRRDLDREVQAGRFRDDLFHRLAVARIELPPLRRRQGDLPLLIAEMCRQLGTDSALFDEEVLARWERYEWPGNLRELRNAVARKVELDMDLVASVAAAASAPARPRHDEVAEMAAEISTILSRGLPLDVARRQTVEAFEARYLERVLDAHDGNVSRAALASGVARRHFHRLLAKARVRDAP